MTGLPLEVIRGLAGLALCVLAVKLLEIFDVEAKQQLEELDRARAIAEERARFRPRPARRHHPVDLRRRPPPRVDRHPLRRPVGPRARCARSWPT